MIVDILKPTSIDTNRSYEDIIKDINSKYKYVDHIEEFLLKCLNIDDGTLEEGKNKMRDESSDDRRQKIALKKENNNMQEKKEKKPFCAEINGKKYGVKPYIRYKAKDGNYHYIPADEIERVLCFVEDSEGKKYRLDEVKLGTADSFYKQLLVLLASKLK